MLVFRIFYVVIPVLLNIKIPLRIIDIDNNPQWNFLICRLRPKVLPTNFS